MDLTPLGKFVSLVTSLIIVVGLMVLLSSCGSDGEGVDTRFESKQQLTCTGTFSMTNGTFTMECE